ncbi:hypothetical protein HELRODRAFT_162245 [Helobdella robusta]|uniref:RBR-type E3 ubiquitin transferase n=1 Tax=Helobdella robusta TaxID=6412 RepID=T1ESE4_HELRO|nr:hypothetical protein HELRODRAFT_162245 [Helobdella robusta]ESN98785.1 hypothetical protein HELRODRAFT_162245 [Helobdella robusta]
MDQCDEIIALKSIYGRSFHCDVDKKPYEGRLHVEINFPDSSSPITVSCNILDKENVVVLNRLSPIYLTFTLPPDYPSKCPPTYTLSCLWLTAEQIKSLRAALDAMWETNNNFVILYNWLTVLQTETSNILKLKFPLLQSEDKILKLTEYDLKRREKEFCCGIHDCQICFCEKSGYMCLKLSGCGHIFCKDCLKSFLDVQIKDGNVKSLQCLAEKCSTEINHSMVKSLVDAETFERYDRLLLKASLESMSDIAYCPRPWCACPVIMDRKNGMGSCQACQYTFCIYCKMGYHGVEKCRLKSEEMKRLYSKYMEATKSEQLELEKIYGKKMFMDILSQVETDNWLETNSKKCPNCKSNIEKNEGCNKMTCTKCKSFFCWLCLKQLDNFNPYSHYSDVKSKCYNQLYPPGGFPENNADDDFFYDFSDGEIDEFD